MERTSFVFESVLSAPDKVEFVKRAKDNGFFIRLFFIATNHPSINASRIAHRVMEGGHDVPISKIISRYKKSILNCLELRNIVDRLYVYDNSVDNEDARPLYLLTNVKIAKIYQNDIPEWAQLILPDGK